MELLYCELFVAKNIMIDEVFGDPVVIAENNNVKSVFKKSLKKLQAK